jgi:hypothetical protein
MKNAQYVQIAVLSLIIIGSLFYISKNSSVSMTAAAINAAPDLVAYYPFDEGSGTTAGDYIGGNSGVLTGGPAWSVGKFGGALSFDGTDDRVVTSPSILSSYPATVCAWIKPNPSSMITSIVNKTNFEFYIYKADTGLYLQLYNNTNNGVISSGTLQTNVWQHVCASVAADGATKIYINGAPSGSGSVTPAQSSASFTIGSRPNSGLNFLGNIDEVRVYNTVLSDGEIASLYALVPTVNTNPPPAPISVNGVCGATVNTCSAGTFLDQADTASNQLWQCTGSGTGATASCSLAITSTEPPTTVTPPPLPTFPLSSDGIIQTDRRIDWGNVGVPGGIPNRTTICATINSATYGNGTTEASGAIQAAIDACPANQVVYIPAGRYKVSSGINMGTHSNLTLRGAGPDQTVLVSYLTGGKVIGMGGYGWLPQATVLSASIISGNTKGSSSMTLSSVAGISAGQVIRIDQDNDPTFVWNIAGRGRLMGQIMMVKSISGNTITFSPPLNFDFKLNPKITTFERVTSFSGIEDLGFDHVNDASVMSIQLDGVYGCWIKNIKSLKPGTYHILSNTALHCEVRDSHFEDSKRYGNNNSGINMYSDNVAWKVENNTFYKTFPGIEVNESSSGNFFGYNFGFQVEGWTDLCCSAEAFNSNHGAHNVMNLWEGNIGEMFMSDGYFGSGSHDTLFRNNFTAYSATKNGNFKAISLNRYTYYYNIVGNVLGSPYFPSTGKYSTEMNPYDYGLALIYRFGYPNSANNGYTGIYDGIQPQSTHEAQNLDRRVEQTTMRWGNYDYLTKTTHWDLKEVPAGLTPPSTQTLPKSLYYPSRPSWWPSSVVWPPIGPDVSGLVNKLPAQICFEQGKMPNCLWSTDTTPTTPILGDFDGNGKVNTLDSSYMNSVWNTNDTKADLNKDGKVNTLDFAIMVKNWTPLGF